VERHQTLRAAVDWSYSLLSPTEQAVFNRLAVFAGGFTMAAATAVTTGDDVETWDVVDALGSLVAKSMLVPEPGGEEHTRYQLLETLRQYAQEGLDADGHTDRWRRRHAHHFAGFAAELALGLRGRDELAWRQQMMDDLDNLRSAVIWGLDSGVHDDEQTAVAIIARLAYDTATKATGIGRWAEQALPALERSTPGYRSAVLGAAAGAALSRGNLDASERYARAALEEGYPPDDPSPGVAAISMAVTHMFSGRKDDAARCLDAAEEAIVGRDDNEWLCSWLQSVRVSVSLFADDEDEEIAQARHAMALAERLGNPTNLAIASYALGWALRHRDPDQAMTAFDRNVALSRRAAATAQLALSLSFGARIAASQGDAEGARARLRESLEVSIRDDDWNFLAASPDTAVDTLCYIGELSAAAVVAGVLDTALAPLRFPYTSSTGTGLSVRTANLARARQTLGDAVYDRAWAEGVAMSRQDALAFVLNHL
jgi:tetratricopeptide (TPR) repeat protein